MCFQKKKANGKDEAGMIKVKQIMHDLLLK